jgi:hypothetical protein
VGQAELSQASKLGAFGSQALAGYQGESRSLYAGTEAVRGTWEILAKCPYSFVTKRDAAVAACNCECTKDLFCIRKLHFSISIGCAVAG